MLCMGFVKPHKQQLDGCPPFMPILASLKTPVYNFLSFWFPCQTQESFQFAEEDLHYLWVVGM